MSHVLSICLSFMCFALLCASMQRHRRTLAAWGLQIDHALPTRPAGLTGLVAILVINMILLGPVHGSVAWFGHMTAGAGITVAALWILSKKS